MDVDTEPQVEEEVEAVTEDYEAEVVEETESSESEVEETRVPLSALQKERRKRQDAEARIQRAEIETQYLKEQYSKQPPEVAEEDYSLEESVTKGDLNATTKQTKAEIKREITEDLWVKANAEKAEYVTEHLDNFLAKKPNLTSAIQGANNRYEEAWLLINALSPKQRKEVTQPRKKVAPNSPSTIPKASSINEVTDVMSMSDEEYRTWRRSKRSR